jgi:hypothetical protein
VDQELDWTKEIYKKMDVKYLYLSAWKENHFEAASNSRHT